MATEKTIRRREYARQYYLAHRDSYSTRARRYREERAAAGLCIRCKGIPESGLMECARCLARHRGKTAVRRERGDMTEYNKAHYRKRRASLREAGRCLKCGFVAPRSGLTSCERCAESSRVHSQTLSGRIGKYKAGARRRGYLYSLPEMLFMDLTTDNCYYCGAAPAPYNGVDRVEPTRGYEIDNCVTACADCNYAKRDLTKDEFEAWLRRAAGHALEMR